MAMGERLDKRQIQVLVRERTLELEHRTPHLVTWQDFGWPAHCGDYCQFVEEVGRPELVELAQHEDPMKWLGRHALWEDAHAPQWDWIRDTSARRKPTLDYDLTVYRFVCRECGLNRLHWDAN